MLTLYHYTFQSGSAIILLVFEHKKYEYGTFLVNWNTTQRCLDRNAFLNSVDALYCIQCKESKTMRLFEAHSWVHMNFNDGLGMALILE